MNDSKLAYRSRNPKKKKKKTVKCLSLDCKATFGATLLRGCQLPFFDHVIHANYKQQRRENAALEYTLIYWFSF